MELREIKPEPVEESALNIVTIKPEPLDAVPVMQIKQEPELSIEVKLEPEAETEVPKPPEPMKTKVIGKVIKRPIKRRVIGKLIERKIFPCLYCNEEFKNGRELFDHKFKTHYSRNKIIKCKFCGMMMKKANLTSHIKAQHPETLKEEKPEIKPEIKPPIIKKEEGIKVIKSDTKSKLSEHLETSTFCHQQTANCLMCNKAVKLVFLNAHMARHGNKLKCSECGKVFRGKERMEKHKLNEHQPTSSKVVKMKSVLKDGEIALECNECDFFTTHEKDLIRHQAAHVRKKTKTFTCLICKKTFFNHPFLKLHIQNDHKR
jgi:uncharacterized C2H2 Zn-finger protein